MKTLFAFLLATGAILHSPTETAAKPVKSRSDQIQITYDAPKNATHEPVFRLLKERKVLEKFKEFLSPLRLPRPLQLKLEGCDGISNAWYGDDAITVCYEYIDDVLRNAPQETTPAGVTRIDAIVGPTVEVFLHEVGHAVFDYLEVPIMGREEDAADQFASYFLLQFAKSDARKLIAGVAYSYNIDASKPSTKIRLRTSTVFPRSASIISFASHTAQMRSCSPTLWRRDICPRNAPKAASTSMIRWIGQSPSSFAPISMKREPSEYEPSNC